MRLSYTCNFQSLQDGFAPQTHENVPLFLIPDYRQTSRRFILLCQGFQPVDMRALWINELGERRVPRCVFVAIVHDGLVGERGKVG